MQIQNNKQLTSSLKTKSSNDIIAALHPGDVAVNRIINRWNNDEMQMAVKGFRKHGKDFQAIAEILGTKSEQQVRLFFGNYKKKFNLDDIVKEYEEEQQQQQEQKTQQKLLNDVEQKISINSPASNHSNDAKNITNKTSSNDNNIMEVSRIREKKNRPKMENHFVLLLICFDWN